MGLGPVPRGSCLNPRGGLEQKEISSLESGHLKGAKAPFSTPRRGTAYIRDAPCRKTAAFFRDEVEDQGHIAPPDWITGAASQGPQGLQDHSEGDRLAPAVIRERLHLTLLFCCQWKREQDFDLQLLDRAMQGERKDEEENGWLKVQAVPVTELDLEPQDYDLDISREVRAGASFMPPQEIRPSGSQPDPPSQGQRGVLSSSGDKAQLPCGPGDKMDSSLRQ